MSEVLNCKRCKKLPWSKDAIKRCLCNGFNLDIGCGPNKQPGFIGMDKRDISNVDIVWDIETVIEPPYYAKKLGATSDPWPFKDNTVDMLLMSHVLEHMKPWGMIEIMNELWRITKPNGQLFIAVPHGSSSGFQQDPTHTKQFNEATWQYFNPQTVELFRIYNPRPWKIHRLNSHPIHNMEVVLHPIKEQVTEVNKKGRKLEKVR